MSRAHKNAFEVLARSFLADHPELVHEWRPVPSRMWGDRLDLIFPPVAAGSSEVWASIRDRAFAIGAGKEHTDFESFGRGLSDEEIAREALDHLVSLLRRNGHLEAVA